MAETISYVNFHGKRYIDIEQLLAKLREIAGDPEKVVVDLDKLSDWLEQVEYPEPVQWVEPRRTDGST